MYFKNFKLIINHFYYIINFKYFTKQIPRFKNKNKEKKSENIEYLYMLGILQNFNWIFNKFQIIKKEK